MPFPEITTCLICDAIRREERGKLTILGFLGVSPNVKIEVSSLANPLPLAFVLLGGSGEGHYDVAFDIVGRTGKSILPQRAGGPVDMAKEQGSILVAEVLTPYPGPGEYRLQLYVGGHLHYEAEFELTV